VLRLKDLAWLRDHKLLPDVILPATAYFSMAVEAARQIHFEEDTTQIRSIRLRNISILSTLAVPDNEIGIETILSLRRGTKSNGRTISSRWSQFTIGSVDPDSGSWTEHCSGEICVETRTSSTKPHERLGVDCRARRLQMDRWYDKFRETGLGYGPAFQGLSNLRAYHRSNSASASVKLVPENTSDEESNYIIHPAVLDTCLQLGLIACHAGQVENVKTALIPIAAGEVVIGNLPSTNKEAQVVAIGQLSGVRGASTDVDLYSPSGELLMSMEQIRLVRYDYMEANKAPAVPREPYWRPVERVDIDTISNRSVKELLPQTFLAQAILTNLDKICALALADLNTTVAADLKTYHRPFAAWLAARSGALRELVPPSGTDTLAIENSASFKELEDVPEAECIRQLHRTMIGALSSDVPGMRVSIEDHLLEKLYESGMAFQPICSRLRDIVDLIAHKAPRMRILQIGGGSGGIPFASAILDALEASTPFQRFQEYVYTDKTPAGQVYAKSKLGHESSVCCHILNIEADLSAQEDMKPESFDLIIQSFGFEPIRDLDTALKNMHTLLKPGGRLVWMDFLKPPSLSIEFLYRAVAGSWNLSGGKVWRDADWGSFLLKWGFSGLNMAFEDGKIESCESASSPISNSHQHNVDNSFTNWRIMLTTKMSDNPLSSSDGGHTVYLLYRQYPPPLLMTARQLLTQMGCSTIAKELQDCKDIPDRAALISFVDIESVTLLHCEASRFEAIQSTVSRCSSVMWLAVNRSVSVPEHTVMKGMLRSLRTENTALKVGFLAIEGDFYAWILRCAELVVKKYLDLQASSEEISDREWKFASGEAYIERLLPDKKLNLEYGLRHGSAREIRDSEVEDGIPIRANFAEPGRLSSLYFSPDPAFDKELEPDSVEIRTSGIGLNMKVSAYPSFENDQPGFLIAHAF